MLDDSVGGLVLLQGDIAGFSWSVSVHGKARLAANGRSPLQEAERSHGRWQINPLGIPVVSRNGVTVLDKDWAIAYARCLAAKHHRNAEPGNITLKEYYERKFIYYKMVQVENCECKSFCQNTQ